MEDGWWNYGSAPATQSAEAVWIFGPTASGKSALALCIAEARDAVILNADASQRWADLRTLTARPSREEEQRAPHALYGTLAHDAPASAGTWLAAILPCIAAIRASGRLPILVGGTGLYLKILLQGMADLPPVPEAIRTRLREELADHGLPTLMEALRQADPALAARLQPGDTQRILRGLEIYRATARPLSDWQADPVLPPLPHLRWQGFRLLPPREALYARIDARAEAMLDSGALEEVAALMAKNPSGPILKTIGLPALSAHLDGRSTRAQTLAALQQATRNYAKRQFTWARHQL